MLNRPHFFLSLGLLLIVAPTLSHAILEEARQSLLQRSPFVKWQPPRQEVPPPPPPVVESGALSRELQFNGIMQIGDATYFNIFDKIENKSVLLGVGEQKGGRFKVVDYNSSGDRSITVQAGDSGRRENIFLATSDGVSIPTAMPAPSVNNAAAQIRGTATINTTTTTPPNSERRRRVIPRRISTPN